jgi:hypothetical protein
MNPDLMYHKYVTPEGKSMEIDMVEENFPQCFM